MTFGELLRGYRAEAGFSQEHLAAGARISVESVSALERGVRRAPHRSTVALLARALELNDAQRAELEAAAGRARARPRHGSGRPELMIALPIQTTSLIGREDDIAALDRLVVKHRLVTITGSGGVGKTRVALEVARRCAPRWEDVRFVDLSPLTDGAFIAGAIVSVLPANAEGNANDVAEALRSIEALVVLDNCEHLIVHVAQLVATVMQACPGVTFLCTSRERLAVTGEAVYRLPSLTVTAAVELFAERAAASDRTTTFSDAGREVIAEICHRLDRIPLAIEIAAVRVATLGLEPLRVRLRDGLALTGGARDLPARQQTMNATIAWSYDLLAEPQGLLLQRISIFAGGFTLAAAESVCAGAGIEADSVADVLASLVDKSLVNVTLTQQRPRYTMLESVRSFAIDKLRQAGEVARLSRGHAEWVAAFADRLDAIRAQFHETDLHLEADPEIENARAALTWALAEKSEEGALLAGRIVGGLRMIWIQNRRHNECVRWAKAALAGIDEERFPRIVAPIVRALIQTSRAEEVLAWSERAIPLFERIGDRMGLALLHSHLSREYRLRGLFEESEAAIARAGELFVSNNAPRSQNDAVFLHNRMWLRLEQGRYDEALADILEGKQIAKALGDAEAFRWELLRSQLEFAAGHNAEAIRIAEDVIERVFKTKAPGGMFWLPGTYGDLACFRVASGDLDGAYIAARESLLRSRANNWGGLADPLVVMAFIAANRAQSRLAAMLVGAVFTIDGAALTDSFNTGGGRAVHRLVITLLSDQLSPQECEKLKAQGATFTVDQAIAEALKVTLDG